MNRPTTTSTRLTRRASLSMAAAAVLSLSVPGPAWAWRVVFDPSNYVKNSMTAIQQYIDTANGYIQMAQDIKQTARKVGDVTAAELGLNTKEGQALVEFINTGKSVHGALRQTQKLHDDLQRVFANSKHLKWEDFVKGIGERKEQGDKLAKTLYDSAMLAEEQLRRAQEQHMKVVNQMPRIEGVTDAAIATAQSVGVIIQQNQGMLQLMAANTRAQGEELQRQAIEREQADKAKQRYIESARDVNAREGAIFRGQPQ